MGVRFNPTHQLRTVKLQAFGEFLEGDPARILLATLDAANRGGMESTSLCKRFLRETDCSPQPSNGLTEALRRKHTQAWDRTADLTTADRLSLYRTPESGLHGAEHRRAQSE
jgi:hypothetical protein